MNRTLSRLGERAPFDTRDDASITALHWVLEADLKSEVVGTEQRFCETHYDELGQHGEIRECPIYSQRGEARLAVQETFTDFVAARDATLDRIAAERALRHLLSS